MSKPNDIEDKLHSLRAALEDCRREFRSEPVGSPMRQGSIGWRALETLLPVVSAIDHTDWAEMVCRDPDLQREQAWLAGPYGSYIFQHELAAADAFFHSISVTSRFEHEALTPWGRSAFLRMRDLFDVLDFTDCRHLIMVGAGPLPVTLIHVHERTAIPRLTSVDTAPEAEAAIARLRRDLGWERLHAVTGNGLEMDYRDADAVYLANLVTPKAEILRQVAGQVAPGTRVIVRDPAGAGELLAERAVAAAAAPGGWRLLARGPGDGRFLSRNIFLVKEE